jgi:non-haem Fe2+, alpha-ketoglutarate-dependent halogenase
VHIVTARLSEQQLNDYDRDGVIFPVRVFSADEAASFRGAFESFADACVGEEARRFDNLHLFFGWAYRLVTHDRLLDAVEGVLGNDIFIYGTLVFYKPPHDSGHAPWHQDSVYSDLHLTPSVSAWVALTASHRANGCMRVIPGSHKQGLLDHTNVRDETTLLRRGERIAADVDDSGAVDVVLQAGEMSLHHSTIVHGSNPNTSGEPRIGFIVRFVTDRGTNLNRPLLRVRGRANCSHLKLAQPPVEMDYQTAFSAWRSFSRS